MSQSISGRRVAAVLAACVATLSTMTAARASVISATPTLPVLGVAYASSSSTGCFPAAGVCVAPGTFTLTPPVTSIFNAAGQDIITAITYTSTLTTLTDVPIGPVTLTGTMEQEVLGRTFSTELGTWDTEILAMSLSGPVLGHTLTLGLDGSHASTGITSIASVGSENLPKFSIDSFFDVFVELSLDTPVPLHTTRGPVIVTLVSVPEPATLAILGLGLAGFGAVRRRRAD